MTQAMALADETWLEDAVATIVGLSIDKAEFTADDLRKEMRPPAHPNWPGIAFGQAKRRGLIEPISTAISQAKSRNHGSLRVWTRKKES